MPKEAMDPLPDTPRRRGRPQRAAQPILDAAIKVFAKEGYSAATIEMISAAAAVSTATLYKKFENKLGLFLAVLAHMTDAYWSEHASETPLPEYVFAPLLSSLTNHAEMGSNREFRGMMRAWMSEVRQDTEVSSLFARSSGTKLLVELGQRVEVLIREGYLDLEKDPVSSSEILAQMMLGVVERFTLMRGLVWGDEAVPLLPADQIALRALQSMVAVYGTPSGRAQFQALANLESHRA
jgi:AcrR family transcriptional regulator